MLENTMRVTDNHLIYVAKRKSSSLPAIVVHVPLHRLQYIPFFSCVNQQSICLLLGSEDVDVCVLPTEKKHTHILFIKSAADFTRHLSMWLFSTLYLIGISIRWHLSQVSVNQILKVRFAYNSNRF